MKKFLTSFLAVVVVLSMAGCLLAADPHNPVDDPTQPSVDPVVVADVVVLTSNDITIDEDLADKVSVDLAAVPATPEALAEVINDLISEDSFVPGGIVISGKPLDEILEPVTMIPLSGTSADLKGTAKMVITVAMDTTQFTNTTTPVATMKCTHSSTVEVAGVKLVAGKWYGADVVTIKIIDAKTAELTVNGPEYFFSTPKVVISKATKTTTASSGGGGCNVGFAPMALLLGLPLFLLKK